MTTLDVNGSPRTLAVDPSTPLLWALREQLGLTGTKFGCGMAQCGACTVLLDGQPIRSCVLPLAAAAGRSVRTIESLGASDGALHAVQAAWIAEQVPQCGYCQSGQIMAAVALLEGNPAPSDEDINGALRGNVCRCGMYSRIRRAIHRAAASLRGEALAGDGPGSRGWTLHRPDGNGHRVVQSFDPATHPAAAQAAQEA